MKKILLTILILTLYSCKQEVRIVTPEQAKIEARKAKIEEGESVIRNNVVKEIEYKGHLYLYSSVHGGITMCHAGHCPCYKRR